LEDSLSKPSLETKVGGVARVGSRQLAINLRLPKELRDALRGAADISQRSINSEVVARLDAIDTIEKEWSLVLAICTLGIGCGSGSFEAEVSRLAKFYGDSPRGDVLRRLVTEASKRV
jgi:Arc-like DNA binding domain